MNQNKQKDFEQKKDWITQMAHFYGWDFIHENSSIGQLQYQKGKLIFNVWTTKMTASMVRMNWQMIYRNIKMDTIEKVFQEPRKVFQYPQSKQGAPNKTVYHK